MNLYLYHISADSYDSSGSINDHKPHLFKRGFNYEDNIHNGKFIKYMSYQGGIFVHRCEHTQGYLFADLKNWISG